MTANSIRVNLEWKKEKSHATLSNLYSADLCFDYTGQPGAKITLLEDKTTGISAVGELFKPDEEEKGIYFKSITLTR